MGEDNAGGATSARATAAVGTNLGKKIQANALAAGRLPGKMADMPSPLDLGNPTVRSAFEEMYRHRERVLYKPALVRLRDALTAMIEELAPRADRPRFRVEPGRIKSANRLLQKVQQDRYAAQIFSVEDIFAVIGDIVGTRVTTDTVSDARELFSWAQNYCGADFPNRTMEHLVERDKDYMSEPKASGYRALHLGLSVIVPQGITQVAVPCELQIRTLLQDAWGELTHEDTFKPGSRVPRIVEVLSARLATTLAAMDEIAQDLRDEINRANDAVAAEQLPTTSDPDSRVVPEKLSDSPHQEVRDGETLEAAFERLFGHHPDRIATTLLRLRQRRGPDRTLSDSSVVHALDELAPMLKEHPEGFSGLALSDNAILDLASQFDRDPSIDRNQVVRFAFETELQKASRPETFDQYFASGSEHLGTVVFVKDDYALIQLANGDTGILHASTFPKYGELFIDVQDHVAQGETVSVQVIDSSYAPRRIKLCLMEAD